MDYDFIKLENENESESQVPASREPNSLPAKRGRKRKYKEEEPTSPDETITCAVCNATLRRGTWNYHKRAIHNNLTWIVGEQPLDLNDQSLVTRTLQALYKSKKPLNCYKCGTKKKSVVGFLSHQATCSKSESEINEIKVKCDICDASMLPVSLSTHMKLLHSAPETKKKQLEEPTRPVGEKRRAALKAQSLIENIQKVDFEETIVTEGLRNYKFSATDKAVMKVLSKELDSEEFSNCRFDNCSFKSMDINTLLEHICSCDIFKNDYISCKICFKSFESAEMFAEHCNSHSKSVKRAEEYNTNSEEEESEGDESSLEEESEQVRKLVASRPQIRCPDFLQKQHKLQSAFALFTPAFKWTCDFRKKYFSDSDLFPTLKVNIKEWIQVKNDEIENYAPELDTSCAFNTKQVKGVVVSKTETTWNNLNLFESSKNESGYTIFCGGAVSDIAWAPTPDDTEAPTEQLLAVSVTLNMNKKFALNKKYNDAGMIQIWNFGELQNGKHSQMPNPVLEYCLCHDFGYISQMEWCPSGCYGEERLGLLAIASSDSNVYVYSLPFAKELGRKKLVKGVPVLQLSLQDNSDLCRQEFHATKLSWTKAKGHQFIAVGYSNGLIAVFDLLTESNLLTYKKDSKILPYLTLQAHSLKITALQLHHLNDGRRWLLSCSLNREIKIWDLDNPAMQIYQNKKHVINDGIWLTHWLTFALGYDDVSFQENLSKVPLNLIHLRDKMEQMSLVYTGSTTTSISENPWINGVISSGSSGEIVGSLPFQLVSYSLNERNHKKRKFILSYTLGIDKNEENQKEDEKQSAPELLTFEEASQQRGLVFCDVNADFGSATHKKNTADLNAKSQNQQPRQYNMYPLISVNKVAFNPNKQCHLYYASGHQSGFVRLHYLKFTSVQNVCKNVTTK